MPRYVKMVPCDCDEEEPSVDLPPKEKTLEQSLVAALLSYNIKHNTKGLAQEVIRMNPEVQDLETLIGLAMKNLRDKYR